MTKQYTVAIKGMTLHDKPARVGEDVSYWQNETGQFAAWSEQENILVETSKSITKLEPHESIQNLWTGKTDGGFKMHVTLKKVVGKVTYWM